MQRRDVVTGAAGLAGALAGGFLVSEPAAAGSGVEAAVRLDRLRLVSLSHVNDPATTSVFPGDPEFTLETVATIPEDGFYMQYVREGEHTGSHWSAPGHFKEGGLLADDLDTADLFLPAVKIDIRDKAARNADYGATVDDIRAFERRHGRIPDESAVILWTGWEDKWGTDAYANLDAAGVIHQPGFTLEAAQWLIRTGRLGRRGALGTDTFSPDRGVDTDFGVTVAVLDRHRITLENLANLASLPPQGAYVLAGGPIHRNGSGSTANLIAFIPR